MKLLFTGDINFRGLEAIDYNKSSEMLSDVVPYIKKEKADKYICKLSEIIQNSHELKQYFKGWAFNHIWVPRLPENIDDLSDYNASENYDLLKCESHLSQAKQIFGILFNDEVAEVRAWQEKISELQKMPV